MNIKKFLNIKLIYIFSVFAFLILLFNNTQYKENKVVLLSYSDEFLVIIFIVYIFFHAKNIKSYKLIFLHMLFIGTGIVGALLWGKQNILAILEDVFVCSKYIITYTFGLIYFRLHKDVYQHIIVTARIICWFLFVLSILNTIAPNYLFPITEGQIGQTLLFGHQTYLTACSVILLLMFSVNYFENNKDLIYIFLSSYLIYVPMTSKGFGFLGIYWCIFIFLIKLKIRNKIFLTVVGLSCCVALAYNAIILYFFSSNIYSPRNILLADSIKILVDRLPFGLGFASFGSPVAYKFYSPMYLQLGYDSNYAMGPNASVNYMSDSFWPCIFAEFGILGTIIFLYILILLFKRGINAYSHNKRIGFILLLILVYLMISSTAEASFLGINGVSFFLLFSLIESMQNDGKFKGMEYKS